MSPVSWVFVHEIFLVAGGLGLFLYGIKMMSEGLRNLAGDRLRAVLEKATSNRFVGALAGALVTAILQSSTATTVMAVGFVDAGMLTLAQVISVKIGANIGTTLTAQLVAFKIDPIAPLLIFIGVILHMFFKSDRVKNIGYIILSVGILFFGITTMSTPLKGFSKMPGFQTILTMFSNPFLALLAGTAVTALIQSSTAVTSIIVTLYMSGVDLDFRTAAFIVLGCNIGTSFTAIIAAIPGNRESKRAAFFHLLFDLIGSSIFGPLILIFPRILMWFQSAWDTGERQIAMFHTLYNIFNGALLIWFIPQITLLLYALFPDKEGKSVNEPS